MTVFETVHKLTLLILPTSMNTQQENIHTYSLSPLTGPKLSLLTYILAAVLLEVGMERI